jgi:hypothetical protein
VIRKLGLSLLAVILPPLAAMRGARGRAWIVILAVWAVGLAVFFGFMAGPGFLVILLAVALALWAVWRRDRARA